MSSPLDNLTTEELNLYLKGAPTDPNTMAIRERINKEFDRQYGTAEVSLTPSCVGETGSWDGEYEVFLLGDKPTAIRATIARDMTTMDLDATDLNDWKQFVIREGYDGAQFWITRLQELSTHEDYNRQGTPVNKEACTLVAKLDLVAQDYAARRKNK